MLIHRSSNILNDEVDISQYRATERHMIVALSKKGFSAKEAFVIARASLIDNGFLKKDGRLTIKGSRRNMTHAHERDNALTDKQFKKLFIQFQMDTSKDSL